MLLLDCLKLPLSFTASKGKRKDIRLKPRVRDLMTKHIYVMFTFDHRPSEAVCDMSDVVTWKNSSKHVKPQYLFRFMKKKRKFIVFLLCLCCGVYMCIFLAAFLAHSSTSVKREAFSLQVIIFHSFFILPPFVLWSRAACRWNIYRNVS